MMTQGMFDVRANRLIARDVFEIVLEGNTAAIQAPGQFVSIRLDGLFLRRPISVCDWDDSSLRLIYKVVGKGTACLSRLQRGEKADVLSGLGNGFSVEKARGKRVALIGGGVGVPPLYGLMRMLKGEDVSCVLGFNEASDVFFEKEFVDLGAKVSVTTADGSQGIKGFVTNALQKMDYDYYYACGPMPMLKAIHALGGEGQLSLEARMGCGFGACVGCSMQMKTGMKRVCSEGPVFTSEEVIL